MYHGRSRAMSTMTANSMLPMWYYYNSGCLPYRTRILLTGDRLISAMTISWMYLTCGWWNENSCNKLHVKHTHEPLVSEPLWEDAHARLGARKRTGKTGAVMTAKMQSETCEDHTDQECGDRARLRSLRIPQIIKRIHLDFSRQL